MGHRERTASGKTGSLSLMGRQRHATRDVKHDLERVMTPPTFCVSVHVEVEGIIKCGECCSRFVAGLEGVINGECFATFEILRESVARLRSTSGNAIPYDFES